MSRPRIPGDVKTPRSTFRQLQRGNARRLRLLLGVYFALALGVGYLAGLALMGNDPLRTGMYELGPESTDPLTILLSYPGQLALAMLCFAWVNYRRILRQGSAGLLRLLPSGSLHRMQLRNVHEEMAIAASLPTPRLFVLESPAANAFACGTKERDAVVIVTSGLVERFPREELQAVVAHEMAHLRNGDTRLMCMLIGMRRAFSLIRYFALGPLRAIFALGHQAASRETLDPKVLMQGPTTEKMKVFARKHRLLLLCLAPILFPIVMGFALTASFLVTVFWMLFIAILPWALFAASAWELWRGDKAWPKTKGWNLGYLVPIGLVVGPAILVLGVLAPLAFSLLRLGLSRNREFDADAGAVEFTRNPGAVLHALQRLKDEDCGKGRLPRALSALMIASSRGPTVEDLPSPEETAELPGFFRGLMRAIEWLLRLFATHPPLSERIARIQSLCAPGSVDPPSEPPLPRETYVRDPFQAWAARRVSEGEDELARHR